MVWPIVPYAGFSPSTPVVPSFYWDVKSAEQRWLYICKELKKLVEYANALGVQINVNAEDVATLESEIQEYIAGGYEEYYQEAAEAYLTEQMDSYISAIFSEACYFGLTEDGYFIAYIPESWEDVGFDTGMVYGAPDYGRLVLTVDTDGTSEVEQPYWTPDLLFKAVMAILGYATSGKATVSNNGS